MMSMLELFPKAIFEHSDREGNVLSKCQLDMSFEHIAALDPLLCNGRILLENLNKYYWNEGMTGRTAESPLIIMLYEYEM